GCGSPQPRWVTPGHPTRKRPARAPRRGGSSACVWFGGGGRFGNDPACRSARGSGGGASTSPRCPSSEKPYCFGAGRPDARPVPIGGRVVTAGRLERRRCRCAPVSGRATLLEQ